MGTRMIYESHDHDMPHGKTQDTSNIFTELGIGESDTKTLEDLSDKIAKGLLEESSGGRGGEKGPKPSETLKDITKGLKPKEDKRSEGGEDSNENGDDGDNEGEGEGGEGRASNSNKEGKKGESESSGSEGGEGNEGEDSERGTGEKGKSLKDISKEAGELSDGDGKGEKEDGLSDKQKQRNAPHDSKALDNATGNILDNLAKANKRMSEKLDELIHKKHNDSKDPGFDKVSKELDKLKKEAGEKTGEEILKDVIKEAASDPDNDKFTPGDSEAELNKMKNDLDRINKATEDEINTLKEIAETLNNIELGDIPQQEVEKLLAGRAESNYKENRITARLNTSGKGRIVGEDVSEFLLSIADEFAEAAVVVEKKPTYRRENRRGNIKTTQGTIIKKGSMAEIEVTAFTRFIFIVDESGSMGSGHDDTLPNIYASIGRFYKRYIDVIVKKHPNASKVLKNAINEVGQFKNPKFNYDEQSLLAFADNCTFKPGLSVKQAYDSGSGLVPSSYYWGGNNEMKMFEVLKNGVVNQITSYPQGYSNNTVLVLITDLGMANIEGVSGTPSERMVKKFTELGKTLKDYTLKNPNLEQKGKKAISELPNCIILTNHETNSLLMKAAISKLNAWKIVATSRVRFGSGDDEGNISRMGRSLSAEEREELKAVGARI